MKGSRRMRSAIKLWGLAGVLMLLLAPTVCNAQRRTIPDWYPRFQTAQRVLLVLPVQLAEGWNADPRLGQSILSDADQALLWGLRGNPEYSLVRVHRFNPVLMRAVADRLITQEQFNTLVTTPTLENARTMLSGLNFGERPLIATFLLEQINLTGGKLRPGIQVQASARLYESGNEIALRTAVATSPPHASSKQAAALAVQRVAADLMSPPLGPTFEIPPMPQPSTAPTGVTLPGNVPIEGASTRPPAAGANPNVRLPGDVPIAGSSTRPPPRPPLPRQIPPATTTPLPLTPGAAPGATPGTTTPAPPDPATSGPTATPVIPPVTPGNPPVAPVTPPISR